MKRSLFQLFLGGVAIVALGVGSLAAQPPAYLPGTPKTPAADVGGMQSARDAFSSPDIQKELPRLGTQLAVIAPATKDYNAYSFVRGIYDRWLQPEAGSLDNPYAGIDRFMAEGGYRRLDTFDTRTEPGRQKVAVYAKIRADGDIQEITSAALQMPDGKWRCKVGSMGLIEVPSLDSLRGPAYGVAVAVYVRDAQAVGAAR